MVYDCMKKSYSFDQSSALSQLCAKYELTEEDNAAVIDAIADIPEYQREFTEIVHKLIDKVGKNVSMVSAAYESMDKVQQVITPLICKCGDTSLNGVVTYRTVYKEMGKTNKN